MASGTHSHISRQDAVARAIQLLHDHGDEPIRISELCRVAGISERGLRYAFHRERGISPKQFDLHERLDEVRRDLCAAPPAQRHPITEIATRHGFTELGRFAHLYKSEYGETPSETLRRHVRDSAVQEP